MPKRMKKKYDFVKNYYEKAAWEHDMVVCGIDEVGRGCLAGPVVTAAAILPPGKTHKLLKDSKVLTEPERLEAYAWILKNCLVSTGIIHHRAIDSHNIYQATILAMKKALFGILIQSEHKIASILVDAVPLNLAHTAYSNIPVRNFSFGEQKSSSIAAASIVAKVEHDLLMSYFDTVFSGYDFAQHKGYGTKKHQYALQKTKKSLIHRNSFLKKLAGTTHESSEQQQTIC